MSRSQRSSHGLVIDLPFAATQITAHPTTQFHRALIINRNDGSRSRYRERCCVQRQWSQLSAAWLPFGPSGVAPVSYRPRHGFVTRQKNKSSMGTSTCTIAIGSTGLLQRAPETDKPSSNGPNTSSNALQTPLPPVERSWESR
jgi:hypothetical protein